MANRIHWMRPEGKKLFDPKMALDANALPLSGLVALLGVSVKVPFGFGFVLEFVSV